VSSVSSVSAVVKSVGHAAGEVSLRSRADTILDAMDGRPYLVEIGTGLTAVGLEAVLIGNAAAALQGAPVTTVDFDFMFRKTPRNLRKLKWLAKALGAMILRPYYPASDLYRVVRDDGLQVDFMATIHGIRSFEGLRDRAQAVEIDEVTIRVASLQDIIKSKRAARRPRDIAVLHVLEKALEETNRQKKTTDRARPRK
jgi:predicted nucleotidyltransferase